MLKQLKTILSLAIGIPAAMIVCGESNGFDGFALQLVALAVLALILAVNGVFKREGAYGE